MTILLDLEKRPLDSGAGRVLLFPVYKSGSGAVMKALMALSGDAGREIVSTCTRQSFDGEDGRQVTLNVSFADGETHTLALVGLGKPSRDPSSACAIQSMGARLAQVANEMHAPSAIFAVPSRGGSEVIERMRNIGIGADRGLYKMDGTAPHLQAVRVSCFNPETGELHELEAAQQRNMRKLVAGLDAGVTFTRDAVNHPFTEEKHPTWLLGHVREQILGDRVKLHAALRLQQLREQGFGLLPRVNGAANTLGSDHEPLLLDIEYTPEGTPLLTVWLLGKGLLYDNGAGDPKPSGTQATMQSDCEGALIMLGVVKALKALGVPVRVRSVNPFATNLNGAAAPQAGGVWKAFNGRKIKVLNWDAEGRLALYDALGYAWAQGATDVVLAATMAGATVVGFGHGNAPVYATRLSTGTRLVASGDLAGESLVLARGDEAIYRELCKVDDADIKNIRGPGKKAAGSLVPWEFMLDTRTHAPAVDGVNAADRHMTYIDVAGTGWPDKRFWHHLQADMASGTLVQTIVMDLITRCQNKGWTPNFA